MFKNHVYNDVELHNATYSNINDQITHLNDSISNNKIATISSKLNLLFGYTS